MNEWNPEWNPRRSKEKTIVGELIYWWGVQVSNLRPTD